MRFQRFRKFFGVSKVEALKFATWGFNIDIPDSDLSQLQTVGELYDFVWVRIRHAKQSAGSPADTFEWIKEYLSKQLNIPEWTIQPDTDPNSLLPEKNKKIWKRIQSESPLVLPDLDVSDHRTKIIVLHLLWVMPAAMVLFSIIGIDYQTSLYLSIPVAAFYMWFQHRKKSLMEKSMIEFTNTVIWYNGRKIEQLIGFSRSDMEQLLNTGISHYAFNNADSVFAERHFKDFGFYE